MKTLQEIKDEVAYYHDYKNWAEPEEDFGSEDYKMIDEVAKRYAEDVLKEVISKAYIMSDSKQRVDLIDILNIIKELK